MSSKSPTISINANKIPDEFTNITAIDENKYNGWTLSASPLTPKRINDCYVIKNILKESRVQSYAGQSSSPRVIYTISASDLNNNDVIITLFSLPYESQKQNVILIPKKESVEEKKPSIWSLGSFGRSSRVAPDNLSPRGGKRNRSKKSKKSKKSTKRNRK